MVNLLPTIRLAQAILKRKLPFLEYKPRSLDSEFYCIRRIKIWARRLSNSSFQASH